MCVCVCMWLCEYVCACEMNVERLWIAYTWANRRRERRTVLTTVNWSQKMANQNAHGHIQIRGICDGQMKSESECVWKKLLLKMMLQIRLLIISKSCVQVEMICFILENRHRTRYTILPPYYDQCNFFCWLLFVSFRFVWVFRFCTPSPPPTPSFSPVTPGEGTIPIFRKYKYSEIQNLRNKQNTNPSKYCGYGYSHTDAHRIYTYTWNTLHTLKIQTSVDFSICKKQARFMLWFNWQTNFLEQIYVTLEIVWRWMRNFTSTTQ